MQINGGKIKSRSVIIMQTSIIMIMVFLSSCKYTNQQNEMLDTLENSGVEISDELRQEASYNWADIIFPLSIVLSFGILSFIIFRKVKRRINDIGYSFGDMKRKIDTIDEKEKVYEKMSEEEKIAFETMQKLFNNKS